MTLDIRHCESKLETSNDINITHVWSSKNPTKQRHKIYRKDQVVDFYNKNGGRVLKKKDVCSQRILYQFISLIKVLVNGNMKNGMPKAAVTWHHVLEAK